LQHSVASAEFCLVNKVSCRRPRIDRLTRGAEAALDAGHQWSQDKQNGDEDQSTYGDHAVSLVELLKKFRLISQFIENLLLDIFGH